MIAQGLRREDLIMEQKPGVKEALSRLSQEEIDARYFRLKRVRSVYLSFWPHLNSRVLDFAPGGPRTPHSYLG